MTGAIWLVQVLVYPNFRMIDALSFQNFHRFHTNRITWIVAPAMGIELMTGVWLSVTQTSAVYFWNFISIFIIWVLTGFVSVPLHRQLEKNPHAEKNKLIWSNWPRTTVWTLRSSLWFVILYNQGFGVT
jgi:hypothetical protein